MMHFIAHWMGLDNASGPQYLFWSGIFGDITIFGGLLGMYYKHTCHEKNCYRIGKHHIDGTPYCTKHRP